MDGVPIAIGLIVIGFFGWLALDDYNTAQVRVACYQNHGDNCDKLK